MIGNIKRPNPLKPFDPSSYFDPTTNTCTEADFIKILEKGVYDSSLVGKFVTLSNSVVYDGGKWIIADVDHDSENTGQTNCYDLISVNCFYDTRFGVSPNWHRSDTTARVWLNDDFYSGLSEAFKARMLNIKYNLYGTWYTDDKIILPSYKEINGGTSSYQQNEGVAYPIFTDNASRMKYKIFSGEAIASAWWTRSRYTGGSSQDWFVSDSGYMNYSSASTYHCLAPLMRVQ